MKKTLRRHAVPVLFLLGVTFAFSCSMRFFPLSSNTFGHDAGIFAYIGYAITEGVPLYTGAWDNKGPLLYLIDALGILISYRNGIFLLEFVSLFAALLFLYKTALLFAPRYISAICAAFSVMPLTVTLEGGNLSEEWALPFTAIAFYFIAKFFCQEYRLRRYEMMIVGACIAAIVLLRLNIIMFLAVAVLGVIIALVRRKRFRTLGEVFLFALAGFLLFTAPFVIWLAATDSLAACLDAAYLGVVGSFSPLSALKFVSNISGMVFSFVSCGGFFLILLFVAVFPFYWYQTRGSESPLKTLLILCFFGLFATLLGNSVSGAYHMHYFLCFLPVMLLPSTWFAMGIYDFLRGNHAKAFAATAVVAALAFGLTVDSLDTLRASVLNNLDPSLNEGYLAISNYVTEHSDPDDKVLLLGSGTAVTSYYRARRLAASNYFYYANGRFSEEAKVSFADQILRDMEENHPRIILFAEESKWNDFTQHLDDPQAFQDLLARDYTKDETPCAFAAYLYTG